MIKNYLLSVTRQIQRNKLFTLINLSGLVIGMSAFLLISQFVLHELSFDKFWKNGDRVYRIQQDRYDKGELATRWASGANGIGPDLKANFPEVEAYVRMTSSNALLSFGDTFFKEEYVYYASQDFFKVFGYPLIMGVDSTALKGPNKIVLSRSLAKKYFGEENPLGKTMRNNGRQEYQVTGVFEDLPGNSHMSVNALLSFATYAKLVGRNSEEELNMWQWDGFFTYVLFHPKVNPTEFEAKLPAFVVKQAGEDLKRFDAGIVLHLQAINEIHLDSDFIGEFKANGNRDTVYFLMVVALLIIVIAWINYVNLSTAKSLERAREVGVRKVMGGFRSQLIQQFMVESLLINTGAVTLSIALVLVLNPYFAQLTGQELGYALFRQPSFWLMTLLFLGAGSILSGLYPAFVLSSFRPVEVLKGKFRNSAKGLVLRKGMVVLQFVASVVLMVGTFTVYQQIQFMRSQQLGINIDQTMVLRSPNITDSTYEQKFLVLKERLLQYPEVANVTGSSSIPGASPDWNAGGIRRLSQREDEAKQYRVIMMDHDFIPTYGLETVAGRPFSGEVSNEHRSVLLNESAVRTMGFQKPEDAIDDQINFWGDTFRIVGVVKNYRQESLKKEFEPLIFRYNNTPDGFYSIKFNTSSVKESVAKFEQDWKDFFPGNPFDFFFLDEHYNKQYKADQLFGRVFGIFSGLAIFISCLGLFGLSSLTAIQRTKEIGVRKVLGASVPSILRLVSRDYLMLMLLAIAVAVPLSAWVMMGWLQDFANRISLSWWIFFLPSFVIVCVAMATVSIHTWQAARTNPANSLRIE